MLIELRGDGREGSPIARDMAEDEEEKSSSRSSYVCSKCGHRITGSGSRIEVGGRFEHRAANPHGFRYCFGCFSDAPGCSVQSESSTFYSWFPGYAWQVCNCGLCSAHLGWSFSKSEDSFYGLILDRLREEEAE